MRANGDMILREIAGETILVPTGRTARKIHGMASLSESGAVLWKRMEAGECTEQDLADALLAEYDVDEETARTDVREFIGRLGELGILE